ncbi:NAD(P)-binding domain-containing protein [Streptomyces tsukubensis]|uniref:Dimethylaniline monooxygenase n=1 Tax=Streptomyces tsukubensis TaxID=83656 RepID=A0A1V4A5B5_9ACTN|nr:NAD(P)-binding domain-containing protein [Streptomyces tsukubensis]OON75366.1 dimethylaniline monooxygenase [Streptomyces tsukubensis]QFR95005.1 SidA/IucD/PvdA family monooxygenase [Streptomyces tsukubensis]
MYDLVVVGAGPYGLSIASHATAAGLRTRVFGRPMASWRDHMPSGMFLKSEPWASNLSDPQGRYGLDAYCALRGGEARHGEPIPVDTFASYGLWFARQAVPTVDERTVTLVVPRPGGFGVVTEDGETFTARTVALAVGVMPFVEIPPALHPLTPDVASHSSHHSDLSRFKGQDVTVIGGGQAALETAALLAEQGTRARVLARSPALSWNTTPLPWERGLIERLRAPHSGLGAGWRNWFYSEMPGAFRQFPAPTRARIAATALGPAGAWWVRDRVESAVEITLGHEVTHAARERGRVRLDLVGRATGTRTVLHTDHVIAATGFAPAAGRLTLLDDETREGLVTSADDGSPEVGAAFESSYPGLFMAGLVTASSFGPSMRFVHGARYTAGRLVRGVRRRLRATPLGENVPRPATAPRYESTGPVAAAGHAEG